MPLSVRIRTPPEVATVGGHMMIRIFIPRRFVFFGACLHSIFHRKSHDPPPTRRLFSLHRKPYHQAETMKIVYLCFTLIGSAAGGIAPQVTVGFHFQVLRNVSLSHKKTEQFSQFLFSPTVSNPSRLESMLERTLSEAWGGLSQC